MSHGESFVARVLFLGSGETPPDLYREGLSRDFHQLVAFKGTEDLSGRIKECRADLILVDLESLPPEHYNRLLDDLSNVPVAQAIPMIVLTETASRALCLLSRAFVLQKEVSMQTLRDTIHRALQASRTQPGLATVEPGEQVCASGGIAQYCTRSSGWFQEAGEPICPLFKKAIVDWLYPVTGYCRGRTDGKLMIPSIADYRQLCTTEHYRSCETFQDKRRQLHHALP